MKNSDGFDSQQVIYDNFLPKKSGFEANLNDSACNSGCVTNKNLAKWHINSMMYALKHPTTVL
jgi:hypothetical protein